MPLTVVECKTAKPTASNQKLSDGQGLFLLVTPTGAKYWRLKYRFGGKERLLALGVFPEVGLAEARAKRDQARRLLADGQDPAAEKKAKQQAAIIDDATRFRAVTERWLAVRKQEWAPKHTRTVVQRLASNILPWLGDRPIDKITTPEVVEVLARAANRGAIETAHRLAHIIKGVFAYAEAAGLVQPGQLGAITNTLPSRQPKHLAAATTPAELAPMLRTIDGYHGTFVVSCALKLGPLLFCRPGELRHMEWTEIDLAASEWVIPGAKMKGLTVRKADREDHLVPLSRQAVEILRQLQPLTGRGPYVFPSARTAGRPMSDNAVLSALRRLGIEKEEMSGHGWRATARTIGAEVLGFRPDLIDAQLGHTVRDANGRAYNRTTFAAERHEMMQIWADFLDKLKSRGADVTPHAKSKRRQT